MNYRKIGRQVLSDFKEYVEKNIEDAFEDILLNKKRSVDNT